MKRRICSILLALVLCIGLLPASVWAASTPPDFSDGWKTLTSEDGGQALSGNYYLTADVAITTSIFISGTVTLDLNGHKLSYDGSNGDATIVPNDSSAHLFLQDSGTGGTIDCGGNARGVRLKNGASFTMNSGTIQHCAPTLAGDPSGGGVYVEGGCSFTMNGGSIQSCSARGGYSAGGGVYVEGSFTMTGGSITGNTAYTGSDVGLFGTMNANGGEVGHISTSSPYQNNSGTITRSDDAADYTTFTGTVKDHKGIGTIEDKAKLTVTFKSADSTVAAQKVLKGQKASAPDVTVEGYTLTGWYKDSALQNAWNFDSDTVMSNMTLYAKWTPTEYRISYELNGGTVSGNPESYTVETNSFTLNNPTRTGYTFAGWTGTDITGTATNFTIAKGSTGDKEYTATWTSNQYRIICELNGGTAGAGAPATHTYGTATTLVAPTRTGYTFGGWYMDADLTSGPVSTLGAADYTSAITLYAKWTRNQYAVTFDSNGGSAVAAQTVYHGDAVTEPKAPTKASHRFDGWYLDGEKYDFAAPVTGDIALTARWTFLVDPDKLAKPEEKPTEKPAGNPFVDVSAANYFHDAVLWAVENGVTGGTDATHFSPFASCSRAQAVTFLYRSALALGLDVSVGEDTNILSYNDAFDVPEYAIPAFQWACGTGIVTGNNGNLNPNSGCTRAQIVAFLWRFAKAAGLDVSVGEDTNILSYNDAFDVPEYAIPAFQWACGESVVTGNNGDLNPNDGCTRAQIVTFLWRLLAE